MVLQFLSGLTCLDDIKTTQQEIEQAKEISISDPAATCPLLLTIESVAAWTEVEGDSATLQNTQCIQAYFLKLIMLNETFKSELFLLCDSVWQLNWEEKLNLPINSQLVQNLRGTLQIFSVTLSKPVDITALKRQRPTTASRSTETLEKSKEVSTKPTRVASKKSSNKKVEGKPSVEQLKEARRTTLHAKLSEDLKGMLLNTV